jgi:ectoine hydroxylase-related dioxygenase (phytanoyl-CoA dioxygenase family)
MKKKVFNFVTDYMKAIQYFHKFGFCIFKNIVSLDDINNVNKEIKEIIKNQSLKHLKKKLASKDSDQLLIKLSKKNDKYRSRIYTVIQDLPSVKKISLNKKFLKIISKLGISIPLIKTAQIRMDMPKEKRFLIPPHQEVKNVKSDNMLFFNTALKKITKKMGTINISPKSHKLGKMIPLVNKFHKYQYIDKTIYKKKFPLTCFELNKGETLMLNMLTIHGSRKNTTTNKIRWSFITRYEDAKRMPYLDLDDSFKKFDLKG